MIRIINFFFQVLGLRFLRIRRTGTRILSLRWRSTRRFFLRRSLFTRSWFVSGGGRLIRYSRFIPRGVGLSACLTTFLGRGHFLRGWFRFGFRNCNFRGDVSTGSNFSGDFSTRRNFCRDFFRSYNRSGWFFLNVFFHGFRLGFFHGGFLALGFFFFRGYSFYWFWRRGCLFFRLVFSCGSNSRFGTSNGFGGLTFRLVLSCGSRNCRFSSTFISFSFGFSDFSSDRLRFISFLNCWFSWRGFFALLF